MNLKKCVMLFCVFAMCMGLCILPVGVQAAEKISFDALCSLDIIPSRNDDMQREITRAEAARYIMGMLKRTDCSAKDTAYSDVKADHELSGYVAAALEIGIVSPSETFRPDDKVLGSEFVKMIIEALNYQNLAIAQGGYPQGYIFAAERLGVLDDVTVQTEGTVTLSIAVKLLGNALNSPVLNEIVAVDKDGNFRFAYESARRTETFLYKKMNIRVFNVFVDEMSQKDNSAAVTLISEKTKTENSEYIIGEKYNFTLGSKTEFSDFSHTYSKIWINEDEEIVCFELAADTEVKYAYIDEINEVHNFGALSEVREIENVALIGSEDYIDIAEDCKFYFDGEEITAGSVPYTGAFARTVIYKDEIISIEGFTMQEGGIVVSVDNGLVTYKNNKWDNKEYKTHASSDELKVIINGEEDNYWGILPEMLFDYCEYDNKVMLVVSSRTVTDNFDGRTGDSVLLGGEEYKKSEAFPVYYSAEGLSYIKTMQESDLLGELVTAHLDLTGRVRYMSIPVYNEENSEFYGFVLGYEEDNFADNVKVKVYRVYGDRVEEKILSATKTVRNTAEFETMKNAALALYGGEGLSVNLKASNDIVWRMRAINGKIVSLKEAENFDQSPKEGGITSVTYIPGGTTAYISSPRIYFDGAIICALYYDDYLGKLSAKILTQADIRDKTFSNVRMDFYNKPNSSEIELALFRGDVKTIATNRADLLNVGIMKLVNYTSGKEGNQAAVVKMLNDATYTVPASGVEGAGTYSVVKYAENVAIPDESPINVVEIMANLNGSPYGWDASETSTSSSAADGFYTDIVTKCDGRRVFLETLTNSEDPTSNVRYYVNITTDYYVYRLTDNPENRFEQVSINEVQPGMRIWYGLRNQFISFIIIE